MNIAQIEQAIQSEARKIEELVDEVRNAGIDAAKAETSFKVGFAQHRLVARAGEGRVTEAMADDLAVEATEKERLNHNLAQSRLTTAREAMRAAQSRLDALRTLAATFRAAGG